MFATSTSWSEATLSWSNAPPRSGSALDSAGAAAADSWVEYDVSAAVTGNGTFAFALTSGSSDSAYFSSREGAHAPELVVESAAAGGPPPSARAPRAPVDGGSRTVVVPGG